VTTVVAILGTEIGVNIIPVSLLFMITEDVVGSKNATRSARRHGTLQVADDPPSALK